MCVCVCVCVCSSLFVLGKSFGFVLLLGWCFQVFDTLLTQRKHKRNTIFFFGERDHITRTDGIPTHSQWDMYVSYSSDHITRTDGIPTHTLVCWCVHVSSSSYDAHTAYLPIRQEARESLKLS